MSIYSFYSMSHMCCSAIGTICIKWFYRWIRNFSKRIDLFRFMDRPNLHLHGQFVVHCCFRTFLLLPFMSSLTLASTLFLLFGYTALYQIESRQFITIFRERLYRAWSLGTRFATNWLVLTHFPIIRVVDRQMCRSTDNWIAVCGHRG